MSCGTRVQHSARAILMAPASSVSSLGDQLRTAGTANCSAACDSATLRRSAPSPVLRLLWLRTPLPNFVCAWRRSRAGRRGCRVGRSSAAGVGGLWGSGLSVVRAAGGVCPGFWFGVRPGSPCRGRPGLVRCGCRPPRSLCPAG
ncbi:hypothetical protein CW362_42650 [Streptomyces populi]|uniref:Uncharacterized protein n=1 Tax=Streptomyces populi TaxID=2058924 RepID=A0A2I0SAT8_9ACTN|nr:hypothetical protein CW362_42650 [Streptomyces populi]